MIKEFSSRGFRGLFLLLFALVAHNSPAAEFLLTNAIVHTVSGDTLTNGSVWVRDGKIVAVGNELTPGKIQVLDLGGQHLYPGLIVLDSALGLSEIAAVRATQDTTEVGDYRSDVESWIVVNPDSELLPVARANGITHFEPAPQGGIVAGLSGLLSMSGWTSEQMAIHHPTALHVYWPTMTLDTRPKEFFKDESKYKSLEDQAKERRAKLKSLEDFFADARAYDLARSAGSAELNPPWEAMRQVVRGQVPIVFHADGLREITAAVHWAQTNNYSIILAGGREAWRAADLLAARKIPVIYESMWQPPGRDSDAYDTQFRAPELLYHAGVKVCFSDGSDSFLAPLARNLPYTAAQAVAFGLPADEAVRGITLYPAQLMGLADRLGAIAPGKEATFFAADGDILDIRSQVKRLWISGQEQSLESRHTRLYEKYKARPKPEASVKTD